MPFDAHQFAISVQLCDVDGEKLFKATVRELPDVGVYAETYQEAYELTVDAIGDLKDLSDELGHSFPMPQEESEEFSGRVTLRIPKSLHRKAAHLAEYEGVSLNQFLSSAIAEHVGLVACRPMLAKWSDERLEGSMARAWKLMATDSRGGTSMTVILPKLSFKAGEGVGTGAISAGASHECGAIDFLPMGELVGRA